MAKRVSLFFDPPKLGETAAWLKLPNSKTYGLTTPRFPSLLLLAWIPTLRGNWVKGCIGMSALHLGGGGGVWCRLCSHLSHLVLLTLVRCMRYVAIFLDPDTADDWCLGATGTPGRKHAYKASVSSITR